MPLCAFLEKHPLENILCDAIPSLFPAASDRNAWEGLGPDIKKEILSLRRQYDALPFPQLWASDYRAFTVSGSRAVFEGPYFTRRRKLIALLMAYCLSPDEKDLIHLCDWLYAICEESTWVISAHNNSHPLPVPEDPVVDLFSAQTGMILSLTLSLIRTDMDRICPEFAARAEREIEKRVLTLFETHDNYWWTGLTERQDLNNWTPWIVSNVMLCAVLGIRDKDRLCRLLRRACMMLDKYIACMPSDGGCDEGAGYWNMAGGCLLDALTLLETITEGQMCLWDDTKIRNIMSYPAKAWLGGSWFVNFADCDARPYLCGERLILAGIKTNEPALIRLGAAMPAQISQDLSDTPQLWRLLNRLFAKRAPSVPASAKPRDVWLPDLQLRILEKGGLTLVCKGGHNGENHNHNDVGSFMVYAGTEPVIVDAGNMTYTALTFSDKRYTLWNTRSLYHNVPLIGSTEQQAGNAFRAHDVKCLPDGLSMDIAGAYPAGTASGMHRTLRSTPDGIIVEESISLPSPEKITFVFMLRSQPEVCGQSVRCSRIMLTPSLPLDTAIQTIPVTDPRMAGSFPGKLYHLAFVTKEAVTRIQVRFSIYNAPCAADTDRS